LLAFSTQPIVNPAAANKLSHGGRYFLSRALAGPLAPPRCRPLNRPSPYRAGASGSSSRPASPEALVFGLIMEDPQPRIAPTFEMLKELPVLESGITS
jgi:hypothetical protein